MDQTRCPHCGNHLEPAHDCQPEAVDSWQHFKRRFREQARSKSYAVEGVETHFLQDAENLLFAIAMNRRSSKRGRRHEKDLQWTNEPSTQRVIQRRLSGRSARSEQYIRDADWWNRNRGDWPLMDCETDRVALYAAKRCWAALESGDMLEVQRLAEQMAERARTAGGDL